MAEVFSRTPSDQQVVMNTMPPDLPMIDRDDDDSGRSTHSAQALRKRESRVVHPDLPSMMFAPEASSSGSSSAPISPLKSKRASVALDPDMPLAILQKTTCKVSPKRESRALCSDMSAFSSSSATTCISADNTEATKSLSPKVIRKRYSLPAHSDLPTILDAEELDSSSTNNRMLKNTRHGRQYKSLSDLAPVEEDEDSVPVSDRKAAVAAARARRRHSRAIHPDLPPVEEVEDVENKKAAVAAARARRQSRISGIIQLPAGFGDNVDSTSTLTPPSARKRYSLPVHPDLPMFLDDPDDDEGSIERPFARVMSRQHSEPIMNDQHDKKAAVAAARARRRHSRGIHPDLPSFFTNASPEVLYASLNSSSNFELPLLLEGNHEDESESSSRVVEENNAAVASLQNKVTELEKKRRQMEQWYQSKLEKVKDEDQKIIQELQEEREKLKSQIDQAPVQKKEDEKPEDEKIIIQQLKDERNSLSQKLEGTQASADSVNEEFHQYRQSIVEDKMIIQQLKDERSELQFKLTHAQERSQSDQVDLYQQNRSSLEDKLIIHQLKDERNLLQSRLSQTEERTTESSEPASYERNRSTIEDKLVIQQLKDERNDLRSQLAHARQHAEQSAAEGGEAYQRNRSTLEDKLIIQQLKDERNELRSKLSEAERRALDRIEGESYERNRSTIEDKLVIQQLKDERNELRSKLADAQERKKVDASQRSRTAMEDKLVIQQLKDERSELQSKLAQAQARGVEEYSSRLLTIRQKHSLIVQKLKTEQNELLAKLQQAQTTNKTPAKSRNPLQPEDLASLNESFTSIDRASRASLPKEMPSPVPSESSRSTATSSKLRELRAHKKSIESHLKTMVSPTNVNSMMGGLQDELAANKQVIAEQKDLLKQSAAKHRSHERIIAEQQIQLKLLNRKRRSQQNLAVRREKYERRLDHWKERLRHDLEARYESLLEQYARQLDYFEQEYDVKTYVSQEALPYIGGGLLILAKLLVIFILWFYKE